MAQLVAALRVDAQQLEPVLETLALLDWVRQLSEADTPDESRYVLLAEPATTLLAPLLQQLLLGRSAAVEKLWTKGGWNSLTLDDAL
jgi:membrane protein